MARYGAKMVENEEETQAQNKVAFGLITLLFIYSIGFFFLWALFMYTPVGALVSGFSVYLFAVYHNRMIDGKVDFLFILMLPNLLTSYGFPRTDVYERFVTPFQKK